jgi:predicted nucleic acid-binding protein
MDDHPLTKRASVGGVRQLSLRPPVCVFPELSALEDLFRSLSSVRQPSPKRWADAYLAAHANATGATLVTFESGAGEMRRGLQAAGYLATVVMFVVFYHVTGFVACR